jgi:protein TonB
MKTQFDNFDDIIFENRNKDYGAYELRRKYSKRGTISLVISLILVSFLAGGPLIAGMISHDNFPLNLDSLTPIAEISEMPKDEPEPLPKDPIQPEAVKPPIFVVPTVVDEISQPDIELASVDILTGYANNSLDLETSSGNVESKKEEEIIPNIDDSEHSVIELKEKPLFPGGDNGLLKYIAENTVYPIVALESNIQGTVYIRFVVTKTGDVGKVTLIRSADPLLDEEALRVVKTIPKWTPGKNNGNPVNVWFIIPVKFELMK